MGEAVVGAYVNAGAAFTKDKFFVTSTPGINLFKADFTDTKFPIDHEVFKKQLTGLLQGILAGFRQTIDLSKYPIIAGLTPKIDIVNDLLHIDLGNLST